MEYKKPVQEVVVGMEGGAMERLMVTDKSVRVTVEVEHLDNNDDDSLYKVCNTPH